MPIKTICARRSTVTLVVGVRGASAILNSTVSAPAGPFVSPALTVRLNLAARAARARAGVAFSSVRRRTTPRANAKPIFIPLPSTNRGRNCSKGLERQSDALPTTDTYCDHATAHAIAVHGVDKTGGQHSASGTDWMA